MRNNMNQIRGNERTTPVHSGSFNVYEYIEELESQVSHLKSLQEQTQKIMYQHMAQEELFRIEVLDRLNKQIAILQEQNTFLR